MADQTKDLLARLSDLSEGAIQRISEAPGADKAVQALKGMGDQINELQRRVRGLEELEKRRTALENKVDGMAKPKPRARATKAASAPKKPPQP